MYHLDGDAVLMLFFCGAMIMASAIAAAAATHERHTSTREDDKPPETYIWLFLAIALIFAIVGYQVIHERDIEMRHAEYQPLQAPN